VNGSYQMEDKLLDWRGNEIKQGSEILYVVVHSSSVELVEGYVVEIQENPYKTNWNREKHAYILVVQPTKRNSHGWIRSDEEKTQVIRALERVTVIG